MMEKHERLMLLDDLQQLAKMQPGLPWWVMDIMRILADVISELDEVVSDVDNLAATSVEHKLRLDSLSSKYSELLYKLKSGD